MTKEGMEKITNLEVNSAWYKKCACVQGGLAALSLIVGAAPIAPVIFASIYLVAKRYNDRKRNRILADTGLFDKKDQVDYQTMREEKYHSLAESGRSFSRNVIYIGAGVTLAGMTLVASPFIAIVGAATMIAGAITSATCDSMDKMGKTPCKTLGTMPASNTALTTA